MTTMDPSPTLYYPKEEINAKMFLEEYATSKESTINMQRCFYKAFSSGLVSGKTLIDFSLGPDITHLFAICEFIEEITMLKLNDASMKELELWKKKDPKAFDWTQTSKLSLELKQLSSDGWEEKEENLRGKIKEIKKLDLNNDDLVNSLPKFDSATSVRGLEAISKDREDYRRNLRKIGKLIKRGGLLLLYEDINASNIKIGKDKFQMLSTDESFYRKVISEEGFEIKHFENLDKLMNNDSVNHEKIVFMVSQKVREA